MATLLFVTYLGILATITIFGALLVANTPYFTTLAFLKFTKIAIARNRYETILQ
ncbi:hypothetical protein PN480_17755 [Dolichospermum circinale CS-1225]|uniref:hypothetical protein n=1 Tax=Dolichospermum circinale TaxID=109265 RepID=UPI00232AD243|nr:hypothetical protein [Dolichospermum circinale]MDB9468461.1 hypothetical protein [Dolichospermum circinale CS-539/09]MDB9471804.1 hypothetical protein [Dolichospermum circinale CS-539]MDB9523776.1 hypothetical protein [Dolichospermum circinale CS-1225]